MKKVIFSIITCFAAIQSTYAATPALTESLLEYEAITSAIGAPGFDVIPVTEFIVDIERITKQLDILGEVKYEILTRTPGDESEWEHRESSSDRHRRHSRPNKYIATLLVSPNPGIGPNIVTVESIVQVTSHHHGHCDHHHHHHH